ncbi:hypothetical protein [Shewanella sp. YLB-07]|uniref:hypothetical protein n=1 Tax=Shewanella sp. YLB-07 TaxID=2601268 RepID=UPI00128D7039|nr:hypothetical protein [Shewanella sp. YLB-07]MPY24442.1 hypothetical protein [Shewanella sp. YLB-07]
MSNILKLKKIKVILLSSFLLIMLYFLILFLSGNLSKVIIDLEVFEDPTKVVLALEDSRNIEPSISDFINKNGDVEYIDPRDIEKIRTIEQSQLEKSIERFRQEQSRRDDISLLWSVHGLLLIVLIFFVFIGEPDEEEFKSKALFLLSFMALNLLLANLMLITTMTIVALAGLIFRKYYPYLMFMK